jgi:pimeloyl-ACP methyl ester carboxylesterase
VSPERERPGLVVMGVGLAAAAVGAAIGLAAERAAVGRVVRPELAGEDDLDAGPEEPPLGSLRGTPVAVTTEDGVALHVEIDELGAGRTADDRADQRADQRGGQRARKRAVRQPAREGTAQLPTVVFSHGVALSLDSWHFQRAALRGRYPLVLWDQRGHGRSARGPEGSATIDRIGADLAAVIDTVVPEGPLVLLGHSMGGMTVMSLAKQRPEIFAERVIGVGLISSSAGDLARGDLGMPGLGTFVMRLAPTMARGFARTPRMVAAGRRLGSDLESLFVRRYAFSSPVPAGLVRFAAQMIASTRIEVLAEFLPALNKHDERQALATLAGIETLVMVGDQDLLTPPGHAEEIVEHVPEAELVVVADAGHLLMLEHPAVVTEHVLDLMERSLTANAARAQLRSPRRVRRIVKPLRRLRRAGEGSGAA